MPMVPLYCDHVGELGIFDAFYGFWDVGNNFDVGGAREKNPKKSFLIFLARPKNFPGFFCEPPKFFGII